MMFIKIATLLLLSTSVYAKNKTAVCSCLVPKESDGTCPDRTVEAGSKAADPTTQLWEDSGKNRRTPGDQGCCQVAASKNLMKDGNQCVPKPFQCPKLKVGVVENENPIKCGEAKKYNADGSSLFVCVCATQLDLEEAVDGAIMRIAIICGLLFCFFVSYMFHWFCWKKWGCGPDSTPNEELRGKGGCFDYTRHCYGIGCDFFFYYLICCPCRGCYLCFVGCDRTKLYEKDLLKSKKQKANEKELSGAAVTKPVEVTVVAGAPSIMEMTV